MSKIDAALLARLRERYTPESAPPCKVCGGPLSIARTDAGRVDYGCSAWSLDPDKPGDLRVTPGRGIADEHFSASRWTCIRLGDPDVLRLLDAIEAAAR